MRVRKSVLAGISSLGLVLSPSIGATVAFTAGVTAFASIAHASCDSDYETANGDGGSVTAYVVDCGVYMESGCQVELDANFELVSLDSRLSGHYRQSCYITITDNWEDYEDIGWARAEV